MEVDRFPRLPKTLQILIEIAPNSGEQGEGYRDSSKTERAKNAKKQQECNRNHGENIFGSRGEKDGKSPFFSQSAVIYYAK